MNKLAALIISILILSANFSYSQCNPNFLYSLLGIPGIWPDANTGIDDAIVNQAYNQTLTVIVPEDTTIDIQDFGAPISLLVPVNINSFVVDNISGLPSSFSFQCGNTNCTYNNGETGCLLIEGAPDQSMSNTTYSLTINLTIEIDLNDYGLGNQSFPYDATGYELYVRPTTSAIEVVNDDKLHIVAIHSSETNEITYYSSEKDNYTFELHDVMGKTIFSTTLFSNKGENSFVLPSFFSNGVYFISIFNSQKITSIKTYFQSAN